mmetsp:Transcript_130393/g.325287  ORF Transcript_130393/g.325287 Transcript_130393/m.325287 type:complete len:227 (-) Transcript_130393:1468-2148(-)
MPGLQSGHGWAPVLWHNTSSYTSGFGPGLRVLGNVIDSSEIWTITQGINNVLQFHHVDKAVPISVSLVAEILQPIHFSLPNFPHQDQELLLSEFVVCSHAIFPKYVHCLINGAGITHPTQHGSDFNRVQVARGISIKLLEGLLEALDVLRRKAQTLVHDLDSVLDLFEVKSCVLVLTDLGSKPVKVRIQGSKPKCSKKWSKVHIVKHAAIELVILCKGLLEMAPLP